MGIRSVRGVLSRLAVKVQYSIFACNGLFENL